MLKLAGTLDIDVLGHISDRFRQLTGPDIDVLEGYEYIYSDDGWVRYVARKRRRCILLGHIWDFKEIRNGNEYVLECFRCFPHIDSRRVVISYNPFSTVERKTD